MGNGQFSGLLKGIKQRAKGVGQKIVRWIGDKLLNEDDMKKMYLKNTNPHRNDYLKADTPEKKKELITAYRENCQRAAMALDQRLAGNDVEAMKNPGDRAGWFDDSNKISYKHFYQNAKWNQINSSNANGAFNEISKLLANPGARAVVRIRWKGSNSGHVFNIVNAGGKLVGLDGQTNQVFDPMKYLNEGSYRGSNKGSMHVLVTNSGNNTSDIYKVNKDLKNLYIKPRVNTIKKKKKEE